MGNEVFANGNEIACKSGDGKVIAAFPDVCLSPPSPPAGPIPVPYPDTSFSKDMKKGSKKVKIDGKEVMLKDKSFYKTSPLGNEVATKSLGAGVVSHVITGKTYFVAWSMDVKFEGKNVDRHIDLTTSNHASPMGNEQLPLPGLEGMAPPPPEEEDPELCPCCKEPKHPNQRDNNGKPLTKDDKITEAEFYAAAGTTVEVPPGLLSQPNPQLSLPGMGGETPYEAAKRLGCENLPDPADEGCGTYYRPPKLKGKSKINRRKRDIKARWKTLKKEYITANPKKKLSDKDTICHRTAKAAGGCLGDPTGKNLKPKKEMSHDCQALDVLLSKQQAKAKSALLGGT
ncbi:MAG: DUF4150 domain-containing protein [Deltaproteobacteria bacterium]|nr:DUF4150 domain-containing protein [Deltaproteobacteria bacterium]